MNITELYDLTTWLETEIKSPNIVKKYQQLQAILQQNTQPNQPKQPFENQTKSLVNALGQVNLQRLSMEQLSFLEKLEISHFIGKEGVDNVEDILYRNVLDIATAAQKFNEIIQKINNGLNKANQMRTGLAGCVELGEIEKDIILLRVNFAHKAAMSNIADFKKWGSIWFDIGRGIAMAHNGSPEEIKIVGAQKGSVILEMAVGYGIAKTTSLIILEALKVADRILDIRQKVEEIRGLKLSNDKIARELEKEAEAEKKSGIETITTTVSKDLKIKVDGESDKIQALDKAIKNLVDFIEQGGEVDCVLPETDGDKEQSEESEEKQTKMKQLRNTVEEIRLLESKLRQIEHKNS